MKMFFFFSHDLRQFLKCEIFLFFQLKCYGYECVVSEGKLGEKCYDFESSLSSSCFAGREIKLDFGLLSGNVVWKSFMQGKTYFTIF